MAKRRADDMLVARNLAEDLDRAQRLVMAGQVRANGQLVVMPSERFDEAVEFTLDLGPRYFSRGGEKLEAALQAFGLQVQGAVCADVGASTGGFTDCLLQHGAQRVYAIDVGKGQLHWQLRQDPRVTVMEATNARHLKALPELVALATLDASFISLKTLLPVVQGWLLETGDLVALIKPQFEAEKDEADRGQGVVTDPAVHRRILLDLLEFAQRLGLAPAGLMRSPITGPKGNVEFLLWATLRQLPQTEIEALVQMALPGSNS